MIYQRLSDSGGYIFSFQLDGLNCLDIYIYWLAAIDFCIQFFIRHFHSQLRDFLVIHACVFSVILSEILV